MLAVTPSSQNYSGSEATLPEKPVLLSLFAKGVEPYKDWVCPISHQLMVDPVVAQDGHSYERTEITEWLSRSSESPMDRSIIDNKTLYTNIGLKTAIQEWKNNNPELVKKDEQLDRQIDLVALRMKPVPATIVRQSPLITFPLPPWNLVRDMLNRSNSHNLSPRMISPRITQLMRNNSSSSIAIVNG